MVGLQSVTSNFISNGNVGKQLFHGKEQDDFGILFVSLLLTFRSQTKEVPMHLWGDKMYFRINFTLTPPKICSGLFHLHTIKALFWNMNVLTKSYLKGIVIATNTKCILKNPKENIYAV